MRRWCSVVGRQRKQTTISPLADSIKKARKNDKSSNIITEYIVVSKCKNPIWENIKKHDDLGKIKENSAKMYLLYGSECWLISWNLWHTFPITISEFLAIATFRI